MELVIGFLKDWPFLMAAAAIWAFLLPGVMKPGSTRDRWISNLRSESWTERYNGLLHPMLEWFDIRWTRRAIRARADLSSESICFSFSGGLASFTLAVALAYPIIAMFFQWVWSGESINLSGATVFEAEDNDLIRAFALIGLCGALFGAWKLQPKEWTIKHIRTIVLFLLMLLSGVLLATYFRFPFSVSVAFALAGAAAVVGSGMLAVSIAVAFPMAAAFSNIESSEFSIIFTLLLVIFAPLAYTIHQKIDNSPYEGFILCSLSVVGLALIAVSIFLQEKILGEDFGIIVFFGLLPVLNGVADFMSIGATRLLLRIAHRTGNWRGLIWVADFFAAVASFSLLVGSFIAFVIFVRPKNGVMIVKIDNYIDEMNRSPGDHWWFSLIVFTTFLPTAIHAVVASYSLIFVIFPALGEKIVNLLESEGDDYNRMGYLTLVLLMALLWGGPTTLVWEASLLFWSGFPDLRGVALAMADSWAGFLLTMT